MAPMHPVSVGRLRSFVPMPAAHQDSIRGWFRDHKGPVVPCRSGRFPGRRFLRLLLHCRASVVRLQGPVVVFVHIPRRGQNAAVRAPGGRVFSARF